EVVVRDLECDARSVAGALVGADAAAMLELAQRGQGLVDDLVVGRSAVADDEREPAGVVLEGRVVEADTAWRCRSFLGRRSLLSHAMPSRSRVRSEKTSLSSTAVLCPQEDRPRTRSCDVVLTVGSTTYTQLRTLRNSRKDRSTDQRVSVGGLVGSGGSRIPWWVRVLSTLCPAATIRDDGDRRGDRAEESETVPTVLVEFADALIAGSSDAGAVVGGRLCHGSWWRLDPPAVRGIGVAGGVAVLAAAAPPADRPGLAAVEHGLRFAVADPGDREPDEAADERQGRRPHGRGHTGDEVRAFGDGAAQPQEVQPHPPEAEEAEVEGENL